MRALLINGPELRAHLLQTRQEIGQPAHVAARLDVQGGERGRGRADAPGCLGDLDDEAVEGEGGVGQGHVGRVEGGTGRVVAADVGGERAEVGPDTKEVVAETGGGGEG